MEKYNEWDIFESYTGTIWIRREMTQEEMISEGFEEKGWHSESFDTFEKAYERIGYPYDKQINLLDILNNRSINNVDRS